MSLNLVRVSAAQYAPSLGNVAQNFAVSIDHMERAARSGAKILVLPECCLTGYHFSNIASLEPLSEDINGAHIETWRDVSARLGLILVAGIAERDGETLFDTAVVLSPDGKVASYRKIHLWGLEKNLYDAGDQPVVIDTAVGRIGILICYDLWFPELSRALTLQGADILASPANWAGNTNLKSRLDADGRCMGYHLARTTACVNERPVIVADRVGSENGLRYLGNSCIVNASGEVVAGPADDESETLILGDIELGSPKVVQQSHLLSRRPDIYNRSGSEVLA